MAQLAIFRPSRTFWLIVVTLVAGALVPMLQLDGSRGLTALPMHDFVEYWVAGRLNVHGENPYDVDRVQELEREVGREAEAILMWNPPWTLPLVMPLGLLECRAAHFLWLAVLLAVVVWSADALWKLYGGASEHGPLVCILAFTFVPTLVALKVGQISPLVLLGAVLFVVLWKRNYHGLAGAALLLLAIKPHLSYLFWIALLVWCVTQRRWRVLAGGLSAGVASVGLALYFNPAVLSQYWDALAHRPPAQYRSPTLGMVLRLLLGEDQFRLQFLSLIPGLLWLPIYGWRHRNAWDWSERMPMLLFVSLLTAPYGAWLFDLVLLLIPLIQVLAAVRASERAATRSAAACLYLLFNVAVAAQLSHSAEYFAFVWMTPALLLAYLALLPRRSALLS